MNGKRSQVFAILVLLGVAGAGAAGGGVTGEDVSGRLAAVWGDGQPGLGCPPTLAYRLFSDGGTVYRLLFDPPPHALLRALNGRRVKVRGAGPAETARAGPISADPLGLPLAVSDIRGDPADGIAPTASNAVAGTRKWASILCKFADAPAEERPLSYFQGMYGSSYPGLDHYWREVSYDSVNVSGSGAFGWFTLPRPRSYYVSGNPEKADLDKLWKDAIAVADPSVDFGQYDGINLMFNALLDCCAWGGGYWDTVDGVSKVWSVTWEPPWGWGNVSVMSHEIGHGFGLPHSSCDPGAVYDNSWDIMSDAWLCRVADGAYGCVAEHTISYHKEMMGWIQSDRKVTVGVGQRQTVALERLAQPQGAGPLMVKIPVRGSSTNFYTAEARSRAGYDDQLYGEGVVIHEVLTTRDSEALVQDSTGCGNTRDDGAAWTPGETFTRGCISVRVLAASGSGWTVQVSNEAGPDITAEPADQTVPPGQTASLSVGASGSGVLTYQWYKGVSGSADDPVDGATGASFTSPALVATATYWVRVGDDCGTSDSRTAAVAVRGGGEAVYFTAGWNLFSFPWHLTETAIGDVLAPVSGRVASVWAHQGGGWKFYDPAQPGLSDLETVDAGWGYWVNLTGPAILPVSAGGAAGDIQLASGWNLVGYNSTTSHGIATALASIAGKYLSVWSFQGGVWKFYEPAAPELSDLATMDPYYGYWVNATVACTWSLPAGACPATALRRVTH